MAAPLGPDHLSVHISPTRRGPRTITIAVLKPAGRPAAGVWTLTINVSLGAAEACTTSVRYQVW